MEEKTRKEMFEETMSIIEAHTNGKEYLIDFLKNEIVKIQRAKDTPTKTQVENQRLRRIVKEVLFEQSHPVRITELIQDERLANLSVPKVTRLIYPMLDSGEVVRTIQKNVAYFALA